MSKGGKGEGLAVSGVSVSYPGAVDAALADLSLTVDLGETVALVGPSGSGKSTLLMAIAGLVPISSGSIEYAGVNLDGVPPHQRGFGLVFQDGALFPHYTVLDNVGFGLKMAGVKKRERNRRSRDLLEMAGILDLEGRQVSQLSGGERQRVALIRSIAPKPRLLMLDEPFSSLDAPLRLRLAAEVKQILMDTATTAIVVTHDGSEASAIANRSITLSEGRVAP